MARTPLLAQALWTLAATVATGCGGDDAASRLPDAPPGGPVAVLPSPASLTATAECGVTTPPISELTIGNSGSQALVISAAQASGGFVVTTALPLTIASGGQAKLAVRPPAAVIGTDRGGATKTGTLTLTTNEPGAPARTVALSATVVGANLAFTDAAGQALPSPIQITSATDACPAPLAVFVRNTGNAPMTVGAGSASGFAFDGFSGGTIAGGAAAMQMIRPFTVNTAACTGTASVVYTISGTTCGASTATLSAAFSINGSSCFCS